MNNNNSLGLAILFLIAVLFGFAIARVTATRAIHNKQDLEVYTAYDILYLKKEKSVWILSSETASFYEVVDGYFDGLNLLQELSSVDIDDYESYMKNPNDEKLQGFTYFKDFIR